MIVLKNLNIIRKYKKWENIMKYFPKHFADSSGLFTNT